jgi:peptidoglycan/xylan/chitin deacetylase (PgdA/CDA1 family)
MLNKRILVLAGFLVAAAPLAAVVVISVHRSKPQPLRVVVKVAPAPLKPAKLSVPYEQDFAVPVLMYHRIANLTEQESRSPLMRDLTVSPAQFEEQVKYLAENGFTFLLARDVEQAVREGKPLPRKSVAITMDDGYKDNFEQAFPILKKYGAVATIFLVSNTVDTAGHLSWDECRVMHREKVGYGSHTVHHYELPSLTESEMDYELRESKRVIESRVFDVVTSVAYPSGKYNQTVASRAELAGYLAGWKKGGGPVQPGTNMFLLPRVRVNGGSTVTDFKRKVWSGMSVIVNREPSPGAARLAKRRAKQRTA